MIIGVVYLLGIFKMFHGLMNKQVFTDELYSNNVYFPKYHPLIGRAAENGFGPSEKYFGPPHLPGKSG